MPISLQGCTIYFEAPERANHLLLHCRVFSFLSIKKIQLKQKKTFICKVINQFWLKSFSGKRSSCFPSKVEDFIWQWTGCCPFKQAKQLWNAAFQALFWNILFERHKCIFKNHWPHGYVDRFLLFLGFWANPCKLDTDYLIDDCDFLFYSIFLS